MSVRWVRCLVLVLTILVGAGLIAAPASAATRNRSGLPWKSGSYQPVSGPAAQDRFGADRGAGSDLALVYGARDDWGVIENPHWIFDAWKAAPQTVVISAAPWPDGGGGGGSLLACSRGDYDEHWAAFGRNAAASGMAGRTVVRLAWEFNGSWNSWAATDPVRFQYCWRHLMTAAERYAPALRWEWCVNRGVNDALADAARAWPGDRYVDFVGMSSYDGWPPVRDATSWRGQYNAEGGLREWARFAARHHKKLAISEWGLSYQWGEHSGGDNPYYIRRMFGFFRQQKAVMGYESYFDEVDPYQGGALSLNPRGAAEYRRQVRLSRS